MNPAPTVQINFILDGRQWAGRLWFHVPRVGDEVMLGVGRAKRKLLADKDGKAPFGVVRVVWGVERDKSDPWQSVNVEIEALG